MQTDFLLQGYLRRPALTCPAVAEGYGGTSSRKCQRLNGVRLFSTCLCLIGGEQALFLYAAEPFIINLLLLIVSPIIQLQW